MSVDEYVKPEPEQVLLKGLAADGPMQGEELSGPPRGLTLTRNHRILGYYEFSPSTGMWKWREGPQAARDLRSPERAAALQARADEKRQRKAERRKGA